jgi:hypothetical protein
MNKTLAVSCLALAALAPAQGVAVAISALTPVTLQATLGAQQNQASLAPGPLSAFGQVGAPVPPPYAYSGAQIQWSLHEEAALSQAMLAAGCSVVIGGSTASIGQSEFLVEFTGSAPTMPGFLDLLRDDMLEPGSPYPLVAVDVDNDGTIDFANVPASFTFPVVFGPTPKVLRVVMAAHLPGPGIASSQLRLRARPDNGLTITQNAAGCAHPLGLTPVFAQRGLRLTPMPLGGINVFVVGLSQQPVLLPPQYGLPCLLVPSPDIVLLDTTGELTIPLPATLRPITFHVQVVQVQFPPLSLNTGLVTSDGFTIHAQ